MSDDKDIMNRLKSEMPETLDAVKGMTDEQLAQALEQQMNDQSLPVELRQYLASNKKNFIDAALKARKKYNF